MQKNKNIIEKPWIPMEYLSSFPVPGPGVHIFLVPLLVLVLLLLLLLLPSALPDTVLDHCSRRDFPPDFIFGSGTSAAQYEGAAFLDGRTASVWDTFNHDGRRGGATGDVSCDGYHKYKEDIKLMADMGLDAFRISISWSRLIPNGRGAVNPKGIQYYNNLIDEMISNGIQPHVTIYHLDLPQVVEDEYGGWLSPKIVKDFVEFADVCFREFGDRVLFWTTLNEINIAAMGGYDEGQAPPGRCSDRSLCPSGDSSREPYIVAHNMLLSHSAASKLYKEKYKATQNGNVGLNIYTIWFEPHTNSSEDVMATERAKNLFHGWILNPLFYGDYPEELRKRVQTRLPPFTKHESEQIKGSCDFIGINHYYSKRIKNSNRAKANIDAVLADMGIELISDGGGLTPDEYPVRPEGLKRTLEYLKQAYGNPPVYIHENGQMMRRNVTLNDTSRVEYLQAYIGSTLDAIRNGSNTRGYFEWTFLDCLELLDGYESSYGMYYVDLDDKELPRYQKLSARCFTNFLRGNTNSNPYQITAFGGDKGDFTT